MTSFRKDFKKYICGILTLIFFSTLLIDQPISFNNASAQMHGGHNLPPSIIGDREIFLKFDSTEFTTSEKGKFSLALMDNKTSKNIPHVTYIISIRDNENNNLLTENFHGHGGDINLEFVNSNLEKYQINANYDTLAASYVPDFGSPIKIEGPIFSNSGEYKLIAEITGIDFDNTFLPEPLKYEHIIDVKEGINNN